MRCLKPSHLNALCINQAGAAQDLPIVIKMTEHSQDQPTDEPRHRLDDAHFAIVVLAVASFTLIIFVLMVTLLT